MKYKKKQLLWLLLLVVVNPTALLAQGITNTGEKQLHSEAKEAFFLNFENTPTAHFFIDGTLYINKNYTDNGITHFTGTTGTSEWIGAHRQVLSGYGTTEFYNMLVNNAEGITIAKDFGVSGVLDFQHGILYGNDVNAGITIFRENAQAVNASDQSHVNGKVRKFGNTPFRFPIGDEEYYRYAEIAAPTKSTDAFTASYYREDATVKYGTAKDTNVARVNTAEYWLIERTGGNSNPEVTLSWDTSKTSHNIPSDLNELYIVRWDGNKWVNEGQTKTTGNFSTGAITASVSGYGVFTFGSKCNLEIPEIEVVQASCAASATVTIANFDEQATYTLPSGLSHRGAVIEGFELGNTYTLTATKEGCTATQQFTLDSFNEEECNEENLCDIEQPKISIISEPTCEYKFGVLRINNFDSKVRYVFTPNNVTVDDKGWVTDANPNTTYYVTASDLENYCHTPATKVVIGNLPLDCQQTPTCDYEKPSLSKVSQPTCEVRKGEVQITNYNPSLTYSISPQGRINRKGMIIVNASGEYVLTSTNASGCTYSISFEVLTIPTDEDCAGGGDCYIAKPIIEIKEATCTTSGSATIKNYDDNLTYLFTGGAHNNGATVEGLLLGEVYTVLAKNEECTSKQTAFSIPELPEDCGSEEACKKLWDEMIIYQLISPNRDGLNDTWELEDLWEYSVRCGNNENIVRIFNRYGSLVYEKKNYMLDDERFKGKNEGSQGFGKERLLPAGTYFYIIDAEGRVAKTGYIYIVGDNK